MDMTNGRHASVVRAQDSWFTEPGEDMDAHEVVSLSEFGYDEAYAALAEAGVSDPAGALDGETVPIPALRMLRLISTHGKAGA